ncbi:alpha/beta hydrolase [Nocardioides sp. CFH 31398]|uniref:alpha/beta hydrolase n=1 Tax=Nocardioides sp. CFH 31398 TaxID=2919579 RepID=UPI001F056341|nr:alpha/beta hydrolase [Nocardioides sp. CFH 31398]MCH1866791.1 alpha/beta hydrolase [Nocardioides sp. CFH 31398]
MQDVLGPPWTAETIPLADDAEGSVVATLVHRPADEGTVARGAVLHVHGFADYFFQTDFAAWWTSRGWDFYALDLRKYGRSLLPHQTPTDVQDVRTYAEELDAAYERITVRDGHDRLVVSAHSTGALVVALWCEDRRDVQAGTVAGVVLNAPWLDLQGSTLLRTVGTRVIDVVGAVLPGVVVPRTVDGGYGRSLHRDHGGRQTYDLRWKPVESFPVRLGWLRAIRRAHAELHRGLHVDVPVLVLTSDRSAEPPLSADDLRSADVVLDVEHMWRWAPRIGPRVEVVAVEGARHDVVLSEEPALTRVHDALADWADRFLD